MRPPAHASRLANFNRAGAILAIAVLTACSSDAMRFEDQLTTATTLTPNQQAIIKSQQRSAQPYPADVVRQQVSQPIATQPALARQPLPAANAPIRQPQQLNTVAAQPQATPPPARSVTYAPAANGGIVLSPAPAQQPTLRMAGVDPASTGSVAQAAPQASVPQPQQQQLTTIVQQAQESLSQNSEPQKRGWTKTGGTWVTIGQGETLYNLSRRYGVPVKAIAEANNIADPKSVAMGKRVIIPTYNFASGVPVSAPDSDPKTKASRASRGYQGQLRDGGRIARPTTRTARAVPTVPQPVQKPGRNVDPTTTASVPTKPTHARRTVREAVDNSPRTLTAKAQEAVETPKKTSVGSFRWPADGRVISKFGERKPDGTNDGIDISVPVGTPIRASENGTVIYSGSELEQFGDLILVSHANGWVTAYANASSRLVKRGDKVQRGQVIAKSGKTGNATVPQVHFELRKDSRPVDPLKHLSRS